MDQDNPQPASERRGYSRRLQFPVFWRVLIAGGLGALVAILLTDVTDTRIVLVWAFLVVLFLAYRTSQPLQKMAAVARSMVSGQAAQRMPSGVTNRRDENGDLAQSFNRMADSVSTSLERQRLLLGNVSQDLKTPLARQRAAIERMEGGDSNPVLVAIIERQNARMNAIVQDILAFNQLDDDAGDGGYEAVNMVSVVNQVLGHATDYAELRRVDCRLEMSDSARDVLVLGDRTLIHRALEKVLQNALDHSPPGQVVAVRLENTASEMTCTIADKGPGVSEDAMSMLFEPFYREDAARSGDGLGLGLAIAHSIMRAHDGRIEAENGTQGGLVVRLCWPVFS